MMISVFHDGRQLTDYLVYAQQRQGITMQGAQGSWHQSNKGIASEGSSQGAYLILDMG